MSHSYSCTALILAGGHSTRMGQDKALLCDRGQPLIAQTCATALACTDQVTVLTPWPERYRPYLPPQVTLQPEPTFADGPVGPLRALSQAITELPLERPWLLLLACDWVGLSGVSLRAGSQRLSSLPAETYAYLPSGPKGWEPLHGFYRVTALRQTLPSAIAQGKQSFQAWLAPLSITPWPLDRRTLINCNTPEDWQQAQRKSRQITPD